MTEHSLLTINSGSSSVKFRLFTQSRDLTMLASGKVINIGTAPQLITRDELKQGEKITQSLDITCDHEQALRLILNWVHQINHYGSIKSVAHRVVHGGALLTQSVLITQDILEQLKTLCSLAPLHQPQNIAAIEIIRQMHPELIQVACFDTAFHAHHTPLFTDYALPLSLRDKGIRRYGFHGLSYEWITHILKKEHQDIAQKRIIAAHLGNGASLCAIHHGISIDTTMGLTALDGIPMGTRCGSLDPGAIIYMIRELGISPEEIELTLYNDSGLLGLSGVSNDVKTLENSDEERARYALDYFCLKTAQLMGMMAIALGGVDAIIFTGGIGENSESIRKKILKKVEWLQPFSTLIIPANEEKMMALHALSVLGDQKEFN